MRHFLCERNEVRSLLRQSIAHNFFASSLELLALLDNELPTLSKKSGRMDGSSIFRFFTCAKFPLREKEGKLCLIYFTFNLHLARASGRRQSN